MHEFALAESVIVSAEKIARDNGISRVKEIRILVGELQQMSREAFDLGLKTAAGERASMFSGVRFEMEVEKASFECRACGHRWTYTEIQKELGPEEAEFIHFVPEVAHCYVRCGSCSSPDFLVATGRGLWLDSVKGDVS